MHHRRLLGVAHGFGYPVALAWVDPDDARQHDAGRPRGPIGRHLLRFDAAHPFRDRVDGEAISTFVRRLVREELHLDATGPVRGLTQLRTWGWLFTPVTFWFVYPRTTTNADVLPDPVAAVLEVTNTPWHERHRYVVDLRTPGPHRFEKRLHVSPFMSMAQTYELRISPSTDRLVIHLDSWQGDDRAFTSTLDLRSMPFERRRSWRVLTSPTHQAMAVSMRIYTHAARLRAAGQPVVPHPDRG